MKVDNSGWLCSADTTNTHDISESDIEQLLKLAESEDDWLNNVREEAEHYDSIPFAQMNTIQLLTQQQRLTNIAGTIVQFPFGYICTFESRRHLFRGENQDFPYSESSLSRRCRKGCGIKRSDNEIELLHIISNMRICQFRKFIWQFDIIPQWEGKLSEVNYKALAQHYGFETFLLDITNDVRTALFFATCKWVKDHFEPLTQKDIEATERTRYGVIYHSPDWRIDSLNGGTSFKQFAAMQEEGNRPSIIDTGRWDGIAYQIGLQPFHRCLLQNGYVYPMKTISDIKTTGDFERLRFKQSEALSRRIFDMMDQGNKIYPNEGITIIGDIIDKIRNSLVFSEDDLLWAYEIDEARKDIFPTIDGLKNELQSDFTAKLLRDAYGIVGDKHIKFQKEEVKYDLPADTKSYINAMYNDKGFLEPLHVKKYYQTPDSIRYRQQRHRKIFGYELDLST